MGKVLPPEKDLGIKTIFYTIIGPLINPSQATKHVLVVYRPQLLDTVSEVASSLGYTRALFVHSVDGLDEISLLGKTRINELNHGKIKTYEIAPEDFGFSRCTLEEIATGTPGENAAMIKAVFSGKDRGPRYQAVVLNVAGSLMIGNKASSFVEGIRLAGEIIASGEAQKKLNQLVVASKDFRRVI